MAYLLLFGVGGWTQRWPIPTGEDEATRTAIHQVGQAGTGQLPVIDSQTNTPVTLVIAWQHVAAAVVVDAQDASSPDRTTGQYA